MIVACSAAPSAPFHIGLFVKLHFLGTTGYHPNNQRHTACLMIPEMGVIFDAGTGIFRARDLIQTPVLDIFLSHVHLDHCVGLTFLYDVLLGKSLERVTVHVAESKIEAICRQLYAEELFPVRPNFELLPLPKDGRIKFSDDVNLTAIPIVHPGGCHAFRLDWLQRGKSMAYVTDTTADPNADYVRAIRQVDTLIHECYFPDGWEDKAELTGHSCLTPVAKVAAAAEVARCFLVHVNPLDESDQPLDLASVEQYFRHIEVACDRQVIDV